MTADATEEENRVGGGAIGDGAGGWAGQTFHGITFVLSE